ncbi:hypothetical protein LOTGIDRAFT_230289 [Lottia gigantea]|uniref:ATP synthase subunit f, mitochondrial n=1 Tax=Lottia gigantea TaxID=225164 RepID=V4B9G7_LOTGI|nr:hypothetical protein LOTGIDRAFT_230289 [Lottia gigantea]ESP04031.1 hypothetical protein LOTGIDRAFT_230289 [Lottia gigantea]
MGEVAKKAAAEVAVVGDSVIKPRPFFGSPIPGLRDNLNVAKVLRLKTFGIGCYPEGYNPRVHGAYHEMVFYGKPDKRFCDLTLKELPSWLTRRSYTPFALWGGVTRTVARYRHHWWFPLKASPAPIMHLLLFWYFSCYYLSFKVLHATHRKSFYHW